jgi:hypothetical protein
VAYQRGVFWGVVPFTPKAPFDVKFLHKYEEVATTRDLIDAFRRHDVKGALPFSVEGKLRPILAISEPSAELRDITALRLSNITRRVRERQLSQDDEQAIVGGEHPYLFYLRPETVQALTRERAVYAAVIDSPITLNVSAVTTTAIGEINEHEFAVLCERLVTRLGFDLTMLVDRRARELGGGS